jgi:Sema domain
VVFEDNWTTFVKSRLNCSVPGEFPFYYNELQSTHYIESEKLVYAVFTTSPLVTDNSLSNFVISMQQLGTLLQGSLTVI